MLVPALFLLLAFLFVGYIKLMLPNCYYAHLNHILFHSRQVRGFEIIFTFTILQKTTFMKWVSVNNGTSLENFELWGDDKKLADITFSKHTRFARIASNLGKRIFSFEKRGFLTTKEIIKNEYGIKMGEVEEDRPGARRGHVELDGKKYLFVYNENNSGELVLYDEFMQKNLLTCSFNMVTKSFAKTRSLFDSKFASLLLVLCWYTFQPHSTSVAEAIA